MTRGPWIEALDVHAGIVERLARPGSGLWNITEGFERTLAAEATVRAAWTDLDGVRHRLVLPQWEAAALVRSETYWVSAEMIDVVEHAAESIDLAEPMASEDLPVPDGFALLERNVLCPDVRGLTVSFRAISWTAVPGDADSPGGVVFTLWTDITCAEDEVNQRLAGLQARVGAGRYQVMHVGHLPYERSFAEWIATERDYVEEADYEGRMPVGIEERRRLGEQQVAWLRTFWRLIEQRVGHQERAEPDRATARRLQRLRTRAPSEVTVVTLRRFTEDQPPVEGERSVEWSHRWMVRGHWRNQWYASLGRHRQVWIAPFVKGPDDKPLVLKPKVHRWTR